MLARPGHFEGHVRGALCVFIWLWPLATSPQSSWPDLLWLAPPTLSLSLRPCIWFSSFSIIFFILFYFLFFYCLDFLGNAPFIWGPYLPWTAFISCIKNENCVLHLSDTLLPSWFIHLSQSKHVIRGSRPAIRRKNNRNSSTCWPRFLGSSGSGSKGALVVVFRCVWVNAFAYSLHLIASKNM